MTTHTLSVLVENKPGVLARVAGLFSRRGFNIESLAVGPTEHEEISRITILVSVEGAALEQVTKQLNKLVNVLKIVELEEGQAVERELLLVKVGVDEESRPDVLRIVEKYDAKVGDDGPDATTVEVSGDPATLDAMLEALRAVRHPRDGPVRRGRTRPRAAVHDAAPSAPPDSPARRRNPGQRGPFT